MRNQTGENTDELIIQAKHGEAEARSQLLERHRERLCHMVRRRISHRLLPRIDPSDVVQETLVEAAQKLSDYLKMRPVAFYPWLRRLAWENLVRLNDFHVKAQRRSVLRETNLVQPRTDESALQSIDLLSASGPAPVGRLLKAEMKSRLLSAMSRLSKSDCELLVMRFLEQLSIEEIAGALRCTEGSIRTRMTRALGRLATLVDRDLAE